jgi:hypothetical protein
VLKAWTRIFETAAHEMFCLCEADLTRNGQDDDDNTNGLDAPNTQHNDFHSSSSSRDGLGPSPEETRARRDTAAIRRTKVSGLATKL